MLTNSFSDLLDGDWKGQRLDLDTVAESGRRSGRCCWKGIGREGDWKGWRLEGLDLDVVARRVLEGTPIGRDIIAGKGLEGTAIGRVGSGWGLEGTSIGRVGSGRGLKGTPIVRVGRGID